MKSKEWQLVANLEFRHLQLLVALDDTRSVSRVATELNISQPAVSKALNALEAGLGVSLFLRTIRGLEPTAHGLALIRHARDILQDMSSAQNEMEDIREGRVTRLSLGVLPVSAMALVPKFIQRLEAVSVAVSITVQEGTMETLLPKLRANELDLLVGNLPAQLLASDFASEALYEDPLVCVVRLTHPLRQKKSLSWAKVSQYPLLLPPPGTYTRRAIDEWFLQEGLVVPRRHVESVSTLTNIGVLQLTDSVGFLSERVAQHFSRLGLLHELPLRVSHVGIRLGLIWQAQRDHEPILKQMRTMFRDVAAQTLPGE
jgi:DNA-binding transcriptional LysR family regulator